eukprot:scaffold5824_cov373-Prasinococcus_capsulatus_cf.AAC.4
MIIIVIIFCVESATAACLASHHGSVADDASHAGTPARVCGTSLDAHDAAPAARSRFTGRPDNVCGPRSGRSGRWSSSSPDGQVPIQGGVPVPVLASSRTGWRPLPGAGVDDDR